jgi:hypothetical protein
MTAEGLGIPAFAVVSTGFLRQARATARAVGIEHVAIIEYPGVIPNDTAEQLDDKIRTSVVPDLVRALRAPVTVAAAGDEEPDPTAVVVRGSLDEVQDHFDGHLWSDGLPIVPPTRDRVERFLRCTPRAPEEVLGVLLPEQREATVWNVAVNGVMAGCRPEYMPLLVAAVEAICDPEFRIEDAGSTPGWEPLVILSGRRAASLGFNSGAGLMRVGSRANTTVGRFLRLYIRNVAGLRIPPGDTDKGSIGSTFNVALAEDRHSVDDLGWPSFGEDRGFARDDDVVTVQSVVAISPPIYSGGTTASVRIEPIAHLMGTTCGPWAYTGVWYQRWHPLLVLSPSVAAAFAADGWTKDDIRRHLFDTLTIEAHWFEQYPMHVAGAAVSLRELVDEGRAAARYAQSSDPSRRVPLLLRPEWTGIVVAGDPGRNQCKVYVNNHEQGPPVSRKAVFREA